MTPMEIIDGRPDLNRVLGNLAEECLQIVLVRAQPVRRGPTGGELQELVNEQMTNNETLTATLVADTANLRRPDHYAPPCLNSDRRRWRRCEF
jgi:hypothetical protein